MGRKARQTACRNRAGPCLRHEPPIHECLFREEVLKNLLSRLHIGTSAGKYRERARLEEKGQKQIAEASIAGTVNDFRLHPLLTTHLAGYQALSVTPVTLGEPSETPVRNF